MPHTQTFATTPTADDLARYQTVMAERDDTLVAYGYRAGGMRVSLVGRRNLVELGHDGGVLVTVPLTPTGEDA